jgi:MaoC like domain
MNKTLPSNGLGVLARAVLTIGKKARPLSETFEHQYTCEPINLMHVARYKDFVGLPSHGPMPLSYFYLFAQRAQLSMLMDDRFTYPVPGLVHMANSMQMFEPIDPTMPMDLKISAIQLPSENNGRLSILFELVIEQSGRARIGCTSRYLGKRGVKNDLVKQDQEAPAGLHQVAEWTMPQDLGRRYAALSGDYNPIHLWPWSARLFGFKKPIAHGMYSVARAQAAVEQSFGKQVSYLAATFVEPALLPSTVQLEVGGNSFCMLSQDQILATGTFATL